jgi:NDMA-dependent alcohol dehydrogenase
MVMRVRAAVCHGVGVPWRVEELDVGEPNSLEVEVEMRYVGLCHSDEHLRDGSVSAPPQLLRARGRSAGAAGHPIFPIVGGHEGSGVITRVGSRVTGLAAGDQVAMSFMPTCGLCFWCASGRQHLCDQGASTMGGPNVSDGTWRYHLDGRPVNRMAQVGTFADKVVCDHRSVVKIQPWQSLRAAALISCGLATGFNSAAARGGTKPGDVAVIVGCGGVGSGAIQGARLAGARAVVAVDPVAFKRDNALRIGATHALATMNEAKPLISEITWGRMAEVAVLSPGLLDSEIVGEAIHLVGKDGRVVCTAAAPSEMRDISLDLLHLTMFNKAIMGTVFGSVGPRVAVPTLLRLYEDGRLAVDELISAEYSLDEVQRGYDDLHAGVNIRGVVAFA